MKFIRSSVLLISLFISGTVFAADYGVELSWNTDNAEQVLKTLPEQKPHLAS